MTENLPPTGSSTRTFIDSDGQEYEVIWAGDMKLSLTGPRPSHAPDYIEPDSQEELQVKRKYTKSGRYAKPASQASQDLLSGPEATIDWGLD